MIPDLKVLFLLPQGLGEPRVIPPCNLLHKRVIRRADHKPLVGVIGLKLRVKGHPYLGVVLTDRWDQDVPACLGYGLGLFAPTDVHALKGLNRHDVVL